MTYVKNNLQHPENDLPVCEIPSERPPTVRDLPHEAAVDEAHHEEPDGGAQHLPEHGEGRQVGDHAGPCDLHSAGGSMFEL